MKDKYKIYLHFQIGSNTYALVSDVKRKKVKITIKFGTENQLVYVYMSIRYRLRLPNYFFKFILTLYFLLFYWFLNKNISTNKRV